MITILKHPEGLEVPYEVKKYREMEGSLHNDHSHYYCSKCKEPIYGKALIINHDIYCEECGNKISKKQEEQNEL